MSESKNLIFFDILQSYKDEIHWRRGTHIHQNDPQCDASQQHNSNFHLHNKPTAELFFFQVSYL